MGAGGISYSGLAHLNINLGDHGNTLTVTGTAAGTATALFTGDGDDTTYIQATGGAVKLDTGAGQNSTLVGSVVPLDGSVATGIQGALTLIGNGADSLEIASDGSAT